MPIGPGKYDEECTMIRSITSADGVLLAVVHGRLGDGFSMQAPPEVMKKMPSILRAIADDMEEVLGGR